MSQSDIGRICNEIPSDSRWSHLTVYKAELSTKEYGLNFKQLLPAALKVQLCSFGLNSSSVRVKDGQMSMIEGSSHSTKKCKFD